MKSADDYLLSAVVPVGNLDHDLINLEGWIYEHPRIEIILVLDSIDPESNSRKLLTSKSKNYKNIQIFDVNFGGPSQTRNYGLANARGVWVSFFDSDDEPQIDNILKSIKGMKSSVAKVLIGFYETHDRRDSSKSVFDFKSLDSLLNSLPSGIGLWRFVFNREFLIAKKANFSRISMAEDQLFYMNLNLSREDIEIANSIFYKYIVGNKHQLTKNKAKIQDLKIAIMESMEIYETRNPNLDFDFLAAQFYALLKNGSIAKLGSNLLFSFEVLFRIYRKFGFQKFWSVIIYPIRKIK